MAQVGSPPSHAAFISAFHANKDPVVPACATANDSWRASCSPALERQKGPRQARPAHLTSFLRCAHLPLGPLEWCHGRPCGAAPTASPQQGLSP